MCDIVSHSRHARKQVSRIYQAGTHQELRRAVVLPPGHFRAEVCCRQPSLSVSSWFQMPHLSADPHCPAGSSIKIDHDRPPDESVVRAREGGIHEECAVDPRSPIRFVDVAENMQRRPDAADRGKQVLTSLVPTAASRHVEYPERRTVGYH